MIARAILVLIWTFAIARADEAKPWVVGVSEVDQASALALYEQGNSEFHAARFAQALAKYREAVAHWDHPSIHFNMAVCLINLGQPLEASQLLERALQYGADALGRDLYAQGITYQRALESQLARVRITCKEPGAMIMVDGELVFTAPGAAERILMPGRHQIVAKKPGYQTVSETLELVPSKLARYDVRLIALRQTSTIRRWAPWKPYAVLTSGGGTIAIGALAYMLAARAYDRYDERVAANCPRGCNATMAASLANDRHHADLERNISYSLLAVGGSAVIVGALGVWLNQPRVVEAVSVQRGVDNVVVTWTAAW